MSYTKIATTDYIVAENHPSLVDIKNRAGKEIHAKMRVEHDANGKHEMWNALCYGEIYTFTGDGTDNRTITLQDTALTPKFVQVLELPEMDSIVTNGGFDSTTTGWTVETTGDSIASIAGGVSGNCCEVTQGSNNYLSNGGFETDLTGWTVTTSGTGTGSAAGGVAGGISGNCCQFSITNDAGEGTIIRLTQTLTGLVPRAFCWFLIAAKCTDAGLYGANSEIRLRSAGYDTKNASDTFSDANWKSVQIWPTGQADEDGNLTVYFEFETSVTGTFTGIYFDAAIVYCGPVLSQSITTIPGRLYRTDFSAKAVSGSSDSVRIAYSLATMLAESYYTINPGVGWDDLDAGGGQYPSVIPTGATTDLLIYFDAMSISSTTLIDSVSLLHDTTYLAQPYMSDALLDGEFYSLNPTYGILSRGYTTGFATGGFLENFQEGSFDVSFLASHPFDSHVNSNGATNYYLVLGTHADSFPGNTGGTDPNWVEDGQDMLGGVVGTEPGNRVENHIDTQFLVEHNADGTHNTAIFNGFMAIETGEYVVTGGAQSVTVTLENEYIDVKEVWIFKSALWFWSATDQMTQPATKVENEAAFDTGILTNVQQGAFTFDAPSSGYYWWVALGEINVTVV